MPRLTYILAASHSGSTLLAMLLGAHPDVCTVGELKATNFGDTGQYRCSCGALIKECDFWARVSQAISRRGIAGFDITHAGTSIFEVESQYARRLLAPLYRESVVEIIRDVALLLSPEWRSHLRNTRRRNGALIESLIEVSRAKVVIDSSKVALRLKYLLRIPELQIKIIRLIRDGRAVGLTYMDEWNFADASDPALRGGGSGARREPPRRAMKDAAREWKRSNESADCLVNQLPSAQWIQVRYEDLCAQPRSTLKRLCEFLDVSSDEINLDFRSRRQHVIGNGMRLDSSSEVRLDERWRTHLSAQDLRIFEEVAGVMNRGYGYQ